jgi:hypothetical protein
MKQITAKFNSVCHETGKKLNKGDLIFYDTETKKAYHHTAKITVDKEINDIKAYIQAQEDAYWDKITNYYYSK